MYVVDDILCTWTPEVKSRGGRRGNVRPPSCWLDTLPRTELLTVNLCFIFFGSVKWEVCLFYLTNDKHILKGGGGQGLSCSNHLGILCLWAEEYLSFAMKHGKTTAKQSRRPPKV